MDKSYFSVSSALSQVISKSIDSGKKKTEPSEYEERVLCFSDNLLMYDRTYRIRRDVVERLMAQAKEQADCFVKEDDGMILIEKTLGCGIRYSTTYHVAELQNAEESA